jgi:hypothetical protein
MNLLALWATKFAMKLKELNVTVFIAVLTLKRVT